MNRFNRNILAGTFALFAILTLSASILLASGPCRTTALVVGCGGDSDEVFIVCDPELNGSPEWCSYSETHGEVLGCVGADEGDDDCSGPISTICNYTRYWDTCCGATPEPENVSEETNQYIADGNPCPSAI